MLSHVGPLVFEVSAIPCLFINGSEFRQKLIGTIIRVLVWHLRALSGIIHKQRTHVSLCVNFLVVYVAHLHDTMYLADMILGLRQVLDIEQYISQMCFFRTLQLYMYTFHNSISNFTDRVSQKTTS